MQKSVVEDVNVTGKPEPPPVADKVGDELNACGPGFAKVITCGAFGVTEPEAPEARPVPLAFVAVTVNVYAVPFVRPVTDIGLLDPDWICSPEDVTV